MKKLRTHAILVFLASTVTWSNATSPTDFVRLDSQLIAPMNNGPAKVFELDTPNTDRAFSFQLRTGKYWTLDQFGRMSDRWDTLFANMDNTSFDQDTQMVTVVWAQGDISEMDDFVARFGYTGYAFSE